MDVKKIYTEDNTLRNYLFMGAILGATSACIEYMVRINTNEPQEFLPLIIRAIAVGILVGALVTLFEKYFKNRFTEKRYIYLVLVRSFSYTLYYNISPFTNQWSLVCAQ